MEIEQFNNIFEGAEISIVADGLSCNYKEDGCEVIAVNHSYRNLSKKPYGMIFNDDYFISEYNQSETRKLSEIANYIFHGASADAPSAENIFRFFKKTYLTQNIKEGLYGIHSSGLSALSLAVLMGAEKINLHGFDYRIFTREEAKEYFGKDWSVHTSNATHRHDGQDRELVFTSKVIHFEPFAKLKGVEIINHSKHSLIPYFRKQE